MMLSVGNLTAGYIKEVDVLQDISFNLEEATITTMIGPNGAGKSTVLRSIFGLTIIKSGEIFIHDEDITNKNPGDTLKAGISYVPQGRSNFPKMTVHENLEMGAFIKTGDINNDVKKIMKLFPLLKKKKKELAGNLSGGEQQVLEMGMSLILGPKLLMVDEPTLGLAPNMASDVLNAIKRLCELGCTVLMVEQNAKRALSMSDYGIALELGKKRYEGTGEEILNNPEVKRLYLGG